MVVVPMLMPIAPAASESASAALAKPRLIVVSSNPRPVVPAVGCIWAGDSPAAGVAAPLDPAGPEGRGPDPSTEAAPAPVAAGRVPPLLPEALPTADPGVVA